MERTAYQVACDGVRIAWATGETTQRPSYMSMPARSIDGVVRTALVSDIRVPVNAVRAQHTQVLPARTRQGLVPAAHQIGTLLGGMDGIRRGLGYQG
jgi:hypothetical protein